jgi:UrcA family protein
MSAVLSVLVNAAVVTASLADTPGATSHSSLVRYSDLSLDRPADVARLYHRIVHAADSVCGERELTGSFFELSAYRNCFDPAVSNAVAAVGSPALSAYYSAQVSASHRRAATVAQR